MFKGIVDGVRHMHEKLGIIHRDIKLENVMVVRDGGGR